MRVPATLTLCGTLAVSASLRSQDPQAGLDSARAGRFDNGKMWTFEYSPGEYFTSTYGFDASPAWFERARLAVLRIPGCSASFVSPHGLVATNHHCVRSAVARVSEEREALLDNGFYAVEVSTERQIPGYYADQLIAIEDVTDEIFGATDRASTRAAQDAARRRAEGGIEQRLLGEHAVAGDSVWVQFIPLYNGGRYSAYVFRRFTDVRLVAAVELQVGFFGGDPDNFTYPRYALDFAFLRIYGDDGEPYEPAHHFSMGSSGVEAGDVVFVIGNPGQTNRLKTLVELTYQRDVQVPTLIHLLQTRHATLGHFLETDPEAAEAFDTRNRMFSLSNSLKASRGRLAALHDPVIIARRQDAEQALRDSISIDAERRAKYGQIFSELADVQEQKVQHRSGYGAYLAVTSPSLSSSLMLRAFAAVSLLDAPADSLEALRERLVSIPDKPEPVELGFLTHRFADFERYLGAEHGVTQAALGGQSPSEAARALLRASVLGDSARTARAVADGTLDAGDPALQLLDAMATPYSEYVWEAGRLVQKENALASELGRARFAVYGRTVPPDGSFSPRITDGVVQGYEFNGTVAPPYTTFFGLYERHKANQSSVDWALPDRWRTPPAGLDLSTPLNFVSTADTYGGNSGSPAVTPELALVGLNFDRNIEGLSRDYIYLPERGRNVMVDVRAIVAALDHVYDADRIVQELLTGQLYETEAAADAARGR